MSFFSDPSQNACPESFQKVMKQFEFDFDEADKDKSGHLSVDEFKAALVKSGFKEDDKVINKLFFGADKDNSNGISKHEYMNALKEVPKFTQFEANLRQVFHGVDTDDDGILTEGELIAAMSDVRLNGMLTTSDVDELMKVMLQNGEINYEEFIKACGMKGKTSVLKQLYNKLDTNNDGRVTVTEMMTGMEQERDILVLESLNSMIEEMQWTGEDIFNYEEFVQQYMYAEAPYYMNLIK